MGAKELEAAVVSTGVNWRLSAVINHVRLSVNSQKDTLGLL